MQQWLSNVTDKLKAAWASIADKTVPAHVFIVAVGLAFMFGGCVCGSKSVLSEQHGMGWIDDPQAVASVGMPKFGDAAKNLVQAGKDEDALLYKAFEKVTGKPWQPHDQNGTGCCVGEGNAGAIELLSAVEIALGEQQEYRPISAAAIYALAREEGDMLRGPDGAVGAYAAKALMKAGSISCEESKDTNGRDGTANPHAALAKKWGRLGLPESLKTIAATHKVKSASQVRTPEEVRAAITNGYPVTICSSVGFEPFKRDANGFCRPGGTWAHCMFIGAYRADKKAFLVFQSWGPSMPPGPKSLDQPDGTFWISWESCSRIVKAGESYALSSFSGYPARDLPFIIQAPNRRDFARKPDFALAF